MQKSHQANTPRQSNMNRQQHDRKEARTGNSGFAKKRVQWLIEHSTSHQLLCYVDSFELRNPLLRKAAKRCVKPYDELRPNKKQ
ncbi:MAG: hypothetical protein ACOVOQ_05365 [Flavobacterium sp.]